MAWIQKTNANGPYWWNTDFDKPDWNPETQVTFPDGSVGTARMPKVGGQDPEQWMNPYQWETTEGWPGGSPGAYKQILETYPADSGNLVADFINPTKEGSLGNLALAAAGMYAGTAGIAGALGPTLSNLTGTMPPAQLPATPAIPSVPGGEYTYNVSDYGPQQPANLDVQTTQVGDLSDLDKFDYPEPYGPGNPNYLLDSPVMPPAIQPGLPGSGVGPGGLEGPTMPAAIPPGMPGSGVGPGGLPTPVVEAGAGGGILSGASQLIKDNPWLAPILGGVAGSGVLGGGSQQSGTQTTVADIPDWLKPYATDLVSKAQTNFNGQIADSAANPLIGPAQDHLKDTIGGKYLDPSTNPWLKDTYDMAAKQVTDAYKTSTQPRTDALFNRAGAFGPQNSAYTETVAKNRYDLGDNLGNLANTMYGGNYTAERARQFSAATGAPAFTAASTAAKNAPYDQFKSMLSGWGSTSSSPTYSNPLGGALNGVLAGYAANQLFK